jgi:hypothetical protein
MEGYDITMNVMTRLYPAAIPITRVGASRELVAHFQALIIKVPAHYDAQ